MFFVGLMLQEGAEADEVWHDRMNMKRIWFALRKSSRMAQPEYRELHMFVPTAENAKIWVRTPPKYRKIERF